MIFYATKCTQNIILYQRLQRTQHLHIRGSIGLSRNIHCVAIYLAREHPTKALFLEVIFLQAEQPSRQQSLS